MEGETQTLMGASWDDELLLKAYESAMTDVNRALAQRASTSTACSSKSPSSRGSKVHKFSENGSESAEVEVEVDLDVTTSRRPTRDSVEKSDSVSRVTSSSGKSTANNSNNSAITVIRSKSYSWEVGEPCRAVWEEDGEEYEAIVVKVSDGEHGVDLRADQCIIEFIGYENRQTMKKSLLKQSHGFDAREIQKQQAMLDLELDEQPTKINNTPSSSGESKDTKPVINDFENPHDRTKKESKSSSSVPKDEQQVPPVRSPSIPPPPPISLLRNLAATHATSSSGELEDDALNSLLMSWWMCGYQTGYYQAMKDLKK